MVDVPNDELSVVLGPGLDERQHHGGQGVALGRHERELADRRSGGAFGDAVQQVAPSLGELAQLGSEATRLFELTLVLGVVYRGRLAVSQGRAWRLDELSGQGGEQRRREDEQGQCSATAKGAHRGNTRQSGDLSRGLASPR